MATPATVIFSSTFSESEVGLAPSPLALTSLGIRKNGIVGIAMIDPLYRSLTPHTGKQWHAKKSAFRLNTGQTSYAKRTNDRKAMEAMKAKEREMKDEKEAERQVIVLMRLFSLSISKRSSQRRIQAIKDKRAAKEEKERYEKMAEKMHRKRVERLKRREKRNKLLKS